MLCKDRNEIVVEYALRDTSKPIGVAKYLLTSALSDRLKEALPTAHDLVSEFPLLSSLKLRVEIEQVLSERARSLGRADEMVGIPRLLEWLKRNDRSLPGADDFLKVLGVINQAAHGRRMDPEAEREAVQVGTAFLHRILDATHE